MKSEAVTLDVREDIRQGREPFSRIMSAVEGLAPQQDLRLIASFQPVPLFHVMEKRGFRNTTQRLDSGDWEVLFIHQPNTETAQALPSPVPEPSCGASTTTRTVQVDARGLEPPQPLVNILQTLTTLADNATLEARTDRRPMHLYAELEARGFVGATEEQTDGSFITRITRR